MISNLSWVDSHPAATYKNKKEGGFSMNVLRGEIYYADLDPVIGSEQGGIRPVVILQNNVGNRFSPTTIIAPISSKIYKSSLPTHSYVSKRNGIHKDSIVLLEQIRIIDKTRLLEKIDTMTENEILNMNKSLLISIGITG